MLMPTPENLKERIRFAEFELDLRTREVHRNGRKLNILGQPSQILFMLLERPGELVTRDELARELWPAGTFVDFENGLNRAVNRLREALEDSAEHPRFIETLPGRGYRFIAAVDALPVSMDYFCYISRSKIDQLYMALPIGEINEKDERQTTRQEVDSSEEDLNVTRTVALFNGEISYGRKGVIQRERKIKLHYREKLRQVLIAIAKQSPILALAQALRTDQFGALYYHHYGRFSIKEALKRRGGAIPNDTVVTVSTMIDEVTLSLDCSVRFFSEGNQPDGTFIVTSSNWRFFEQKISLQMESVFLILDRQSAEIIGTPLYLKLAEGTEHL
jgi:DNA-binding winged helix-turn-helix (wHTH) protein